MSTELAMNSYVLLGNALHYLVNGSLPDLPVQFSAVADELDALYRKIEPLPPNLILAAVNSLSPEEKHLLDRCCRHCLGVLSDDELSTKLGLPRDVAEGILAELALHRNPSA
jgi:hypothetical protein